MVKKRDVLNIKSWIHDQSVIRHSDDATSVQLAVTALQQEEYNPVLYYKPQHSEDPHLAKDSFVLILQTEFQKQLYQQFSHKILCIDSTHGTNAYKFKLVKLMTLQLVCTVQIQTIICNNMNTVGQPVGWCITVKEDDDVIKLFLEKIKSRSPESQVSVIMTDDGELIHLTIKIPHIPHNMYYAVSSSCSQHVQLYQIDNTGWKAAHDVYGAELRHLLCRWHVDKYVINETTTALCTVVYFYQVMAKQHTIKS